MSILLDEGQRAIAEQARRIVAARTDKARLLALLDMTGEHDDAFWSTATEQGWTGIALPEANGGLGLGLIELGIVAQATGAAPVGAPFLASTDAVAQALLRWGDPALDGDWLARAAAGRAVGAVAFAEGAGVLPSRAATAFAAGRIDGIKHGVTAGLAADAALVWAAHEGEPVLLLADLAGAARTAIDGFDNSRGHADLSFAGTPARVLARGEPARDAALDILARLAVVHAHEQLGGAEALLGMARDYANARTAFGQPIGAFQSVKHRIAELWGLIEVARANCIHAAARDGEPDFRLAAAAARLSASEAYETAARDCVQIHGALGVTWESGLHLHMRRARSLAIEAGNAMFWEDLLVAELTR